MILPASTKAAIGSKTAISVRCVVGPRRFCRRHPTGACLRRVKWGVQRERDRAHSSRRFDTGSAKAPNVHNNGAGKNGSIANDGTGGRGVTPPPDRIHELAEACVRFVERAIGVKLDYEAETLSLLDHYLEEGRKAAREKPETAALVAHAAGAYFGEVVRRRHASWWRTESDDPALFRIELEAAYLSFSPVQLMADALLRTEADIADENEEPAEEQDASERLELDPDDRDAVAQRLAELPPVSDREFYAPSTRLEVIDIAVEAIRARRMGEGDQADSALRPEDYDS